MYYAQCLSYYALSRAHSVINSLTVLDTHTHTHIRVHTHTHTYACTHTHTHAHTILQSCTAIPDSSRQLVEK